MSKPDFDIGTAFSDTFALISQRPVWMIVWGALLVLVPLLPAIPFYSWMATNADILMNDPEAINQASGAVSLANLSSILQFLLLIPIVAAIIRYVLGKSGSAVFAGLRLGMDELWVFLACIALYIGMMIAIMIVLMIAFLVGVVVFVGGNQVAGVLVGILIGFLLMLPILWLSIRLSLLLPASVDLNNFALAESWRATKGRFWPLFGTWFLMVLVSVGLSILWLVVLSIIAVIVVVIGTMMGMASFGTEPETWNWLPLVLIGGVLAIVPTLWLSGVAYVLYCGPFTSAWRQLRPAPVVVADMAVEPEI